MKLKKSMRGSLLAACLLLSQLPLHAAGQAASEGGSRFGTEEAGISLRANLLRWATLTPDLGVLWEVAPAVHYYIGKSKRAYVGAMFKAGQFNYKLSGDGKQGALLGGGLRGGYRLPLTRALALDFGMGLGCLHADYDKYRVTDGVRVRTGEGSKCYWGVTDVGVRLVWRIR